MDEALVAFVTLPVRASCASKRRVAMSPSLNMRHLLLMATAAKPPWRPSGRGLKRSMGKRTNIMKALRTCARRVPTRKFRLEFPLHPWRLFKESNNA